MQILVNSYDDFMNKSILSLRSYLNASKQLSFSFRKKTEKGKEPQDTFAYCSLRENNLLKDGVGCQIMEFKNTDFRADEIFYDNLETRVIMWTKNGKPHFDYLWFNVNDILEESAIILMEYISGFQYNEEHKAYIKNIER